MLFIYFKNKICNKFIYVLFIIFLFGILSGIPFLLILSTLNVWLLEVGFNKTQIGLFSLATIPYSFKFIFGFYVDYLRIPFFSLFFGQKKSWLIFSQFLLVISIIFLCMKNPYSNFLSFSVTDQRGKRKVKAIRLQIKSVQKNPFQPYS